MAVWMFSARLRSWMEGVGEFEGAAGEQVDEVGESGQDARVRGAGGAGGDDLGGNGQVHGDDAIFVEVGLVEAADRGDGGGKGGVEE